MSSEMRAAPALNFDTGPLCWDPGVRISLGATTESACVAPLRILARPTRPAFGVGLSASGAVVAESRQPASALPAVAIAKAGTRELLPRARRDARVEVAACNAMRDPSSVEMFSVSVRDVYTIPWSIERESGCRRKRRKSVDYIFAPLALQSTEICRSDLTFSGSVDILEMHSARQDSGLIPPHLC